MIEFMSQLASEKRFISADKSEFNTFFPELEEDSLIDWKYASVYTTENPKSIDIDSTINNDIKFPFSYNNELSSDGEVAQNTDEFRITKEILHRYIHSNTKISEMTFRHMGNIFKLSQKNAFNNKKPDSYILPEFGYLELKPISLSNDNDKCISGYFQLYDMKNKSYCSEAIGFRPKQEVPGVELVQTSSDSLVFPLYMKDQISLLVVFVEVYSLIGVQQVYLDNFSYDENKITISSVTSIEKCSLKNSLSLHQTSKINISMEIEVKLYDINHNYNRFCRTWSNPPIKNTILSGVHFNEKLCLDPLCRISEFTIKNSSVVKPIKFFQAFVTKDMKERNPIPVIIHYKEQGIQKLYRSPSGNNGKSFVFDQNLYFVPFDCLKDGFIIMTFYSYDDKPIYISFIRLSSFNKESGDITVNLLRYDKPINIEKLTKPTKPFFGTIYHLPSIFLPSDSVKNHISNIYEEKISINTKQVSYFYSILFFNTLISNMRVNFVEKFIINISLFDEKGIDLLRKWIYNVFDPSSIKDFTSRFLTCFTEDLTRLYSNNITDTFLQDLSKYIYIIFDIVYVLVAHGYEKMNRIIVLCNTLSKLVFASREYTSHSKKLNKELSTFVFNTLQVTQTEIIPFICTHLEGIRNLYNQSTDYLYMIFDFLIPFSCSKHLFVYNIYSYASCKNLVSSKCSQYTRLTSFLFSTTMKVFSINNNELNENVFNFYSNLLIVLEPLPSSVKKSVVRSLSPLLTIILMHYKQLHITEGTKFLHVIPFLLFIMHENPCNDYFDGWTLALKLEFIDFLKMLGDVIISQLNSKKFVVENMSLLQNLYERYTREVLRFLDALSDENFNNLIENILHVILSLLTTFQSPSNFRYIFVIVRKIIDISPLQKELIYSIVEFSVVADRKIRVFVLAVLFYHMNMEYKMNKSIDYSIMFIQDAFTRVILDANPELLNHLRDFLRDILLFDIHNISIDRQVSSIVSNLEKSILYMLKDATSEVPLSKRLSHLYKLADLSMNNPSTRMIWLEQMVHLCIEHNDYITAAICQLHISALIYILVEYRDNKLSGDKSSKGSENTFSSIKQPIRTALNISMGKYWNISEYFASIPSIYKEFKRVSLPKITKVSPSDKLDRFNYETLLESLKLVTFYLQCSGMYYTATSLLSMCVSLSYITGSFEEAEHIWKDLETLLPKVSYYELPFSFYYVEERFHDKTKRRVFCFKTTNPVDVIMLLKNRENISGSLCENHAETCLDSKSGTCIVKINPIFSSDSYKNLEYSWSGFESMITNLSKDTIKQLYITTIQDIPHCINGVKCKCEIKEKSTLEYCTETVFNVKHIIESIIGDYKQYAKFEDKQDPEVHKLYVSDVYRFNSAVSHIQQDKIKECLEVIKNRDEILYDKLSSELDNIMSVLTKYHEKVREDLYNEERR